MEASAFFAVVLCLLGLTGVASGYGNMKTAICEMSNTTGVLSAPISGTINLDQEEEGNITITVSLHGFNISNTTTVHPFHVHEFGELGDECQDAGVVYNPTNAGRGERAVGDLGSVEAANGIVETTIHDYMLSMFGNFSIIGRSFMIHPPLSDRTPGDRWGCCLIIDTTATTTMTTTMTTTTTVKSSAAGISALLLLLIAAFILTTLLQ